MDEAKAHARLAYETFDARRKAFEAAQADTIDLLELEQEAKSVKTDDRRLTVRKIFESEI